MRSDTSARRPRASSTPAKSFEHAGRALAVVRVDEDSLTRILSDGLGGRGVVFVIHELPPEGSVTG
jgi:hypothetical protein